MKLLVLLKIGYTELQYWLIGMTPERYHYLQSRNYDQLGSPSRSAHHAHEVLKYAEYPEPRARLGYYYANLERYAEAVEHYRKAVEKWPYPPVMLALAHAEMRNGDRIAAAKMIQRVEASDMKTQLAQAISDVRCELDARRF